jgi:phosphonatase-like hydrolase
MAFTELVVFDMAGTTVQDKGNIADAFQLAFQRKNIQVPLAEVNGVMGWRKIDAIRMLLERNAPHRFYEDPGLAADIHTYFEASMVEFYENDRELRPLPYAEEVFALLRGEGIKVALNTGFTRVITDTILRRLNWKVSPFIDATISSDEVDHGRPYPDMIRELMRILSVDDANSVAKVGDTAIDVEEGRNAKCGLVVAVTTGAYTMSELEQYKPDAIIEDLSRLAHLLIN